MGATGIAKAVGLAMFGGDIERATLLADRWLDGQVWARGAHFPRGRDLSAVLQYEWEQRVRLPSGAVRITIGEVNGVLSRIDRRHEDRGRDKASTLAELISGRCSAVEIKWLVRLLMRWLAIGDRPSMPVAHKGEWPKLARTRTPILALALTQTLTLALHCTYPESEPESEPEPEPEPEPYPHRRATKVAPPAHNDQAQRPSATPSTEVCASWRPT